MPAIPNHDLLQLLYDRHLNLFYLMAGFLCLLIYKRPQYEAGEKLVLHRSRYQADAQAVNERNMPDSLAENTRGRPHAADQEPHR